MKSIIITGGNFNNKGAQAMSYLTISYLSKKFPDHTIYFSSPLDFDKPHSQYKFNIIDNPFSTPYFLGEGIIRKILGKRNRVNPAQYRSILKQCDYLFDISGYALSSQWGEKNCRMFINQFRIAHKFGIKTVMMPQSIGPLEFDDTFLNEISEVLKKVTVIMPREAEGIEQLSELNVKDNVFPSPDLVLTSKTDADLRTIFNTERERKVFEIPQSSVAVIPNMRNFDHGKKSEILALYRTLVQEILASGKSVYLIRHSGEDIEACREIKNMFQTENRVSMIIDDLEPSEFESLIVQFEFAIASRFHSIVHSYKMNVPCLILGWATKYQELAKLFRQEAFVYDIRGHIESAAIRESLGMLMADLDFQKEQIRHGLILLQQKEDPFEIAFKELNV